MGLLKQVGHIMQIINFLYEPHSTLHKAGEYQTDTSS